MAKVTLTGIQCDSCPNTSLTHAMFVCDDCGKDACSVHAKVTSITIGVHEASGDTSQSFEVAQCPVCGALKKIELTTLTNKIGEGVASLT